MLQSYAICMVWQILYFLPSIHTAITTAQKSELINGGNNFAINLYSELLTENEKNQTNKSFIFSPFSIQSSFAMLYAGTRGIVAEELEKTFNFGTDGKFVLSENFKEIFDAYKRSSIMKIANKIIVDNNVQLRPEYQDIIRENYDSDVQLLDMKNTNDAAGIINYWIDNKTNGKIKNIINPDSLNPNTRLILLSAIYLNGEWLHSFNINKTIQKDFWLTKTESKKIDMMHITEKFKFRKISEINSYMIELPYANSNLSMIILVPKEREGLKQIESKINELDLIQWTDKMRKDKIDLYMPKFNIETEIDLTRPLKKMGLRAIFSGGDFSDLAKYNGPIQVSKATHKAIIEINEKGTKASAATKTEISTRSGPRRIVADHPFLFIIKDISGHNFFMGRMNG